MLIVLWWSYNTITEAIEKLGSVPLIYLICYRISHVFDSCPFPPTAPPLPLHHPPPLHADAASASLVPASSSSSCYHHLLETHAPGLRTIFLQKSIIGYAVVYYATVFCLFRKYSPISLNPDSSISICRGEYYQIPYYHRFVCFPVIRLVAL